MFTDFFRKGREKDLRKIVSLLAENKRIKDTNEELEYANDILKRRFNIGIPGISVFSGEPQDEKNRESYVAEVHMFYEAILKKKIELLVAETREELASITSVIQNAVPRDKYDWFLRGTENALWKLYEWGETLSGEHQQNIINRTTNDN